MNDERPVRRDSRRRARAPSVLLAALLVHANYVVPTERLADIVWDGHPLQGRRQGLREEHAARLEQPHVQVVEWRVAHSTEPSLGTLPLAKQAVDRRMPLQAPGPHPAFERHHNDHRPHMALSSAAPLKPLPAQVTDLEAFRVRRHDRAGGVIREYQHAA
jgi:hypothetical protein